MKIWTQKPYQQITNLHDENLAAGTFLCYTIIRMSMLKYPTQIIYYG